MRSLLISCLIFCGGLHAQNVNLSGGPIYEGEPFIAMNPNDHQHLVVAWMGFQFGEKVVIKTTASFDGGANWSAIVNLPHILPTNGSADPSVRIDNNGNVFVCYIDYDNENFLDGAVVVAKSTNGGLTWGTPVEAININQCVDQLCIDRPWMVVDNSGTGTDGYIYITSMNAGQPTLVVPPYHPYLAVSTDNGASFGPLRLLDTVNYQVGSLIDKPMPTPAVGADGRFVAIYPSYETSQSVFAQNFMAASVDGGVSLNHTLVNQVSQGFSETSTKKGPLLVASKVNPNHYAFLQLSEVAGDLDVYLLESFDAGQTWQTPVRVNDDQEGNGVLQDLVWADFNAQDDLVVCWRDRRNGGAGFAVDSDIYAAVKFIDSVQFSANFPITDITVVHDPMLESSGNDFMSVAFSGDTIHAVWGDVRNNVINIFYNKMSVLNPVLSISSISSANWSLSALYPNPTTHVVHLDEQLKGFNYRVISNEGKKVKFGVLETTQLSLETLPPGNYTLIFEAGSELHSFSVHLR